jgi:uroporphyrinogen-III synthase
MTPTPKRRAASPPRDKPLAGKRILVTRAKTQAAELSRLLTDLGAIPVEMPTIEIVPSNASRLDAALTKMSRYDWVVVTSANAVEIVFERAFALGRDARLFAGVKIAAIGDGTAAALGAHGIVADVVPPEFIAESLCDEIAKTGSVAGKRFLLPRAAGARPVLVQRVTRAGGEVDEIPIYSSAPTRYGEAEVSAALANLDVATFTSSSTVSHFARIVGAARLKNAFGGRRAKRPLVATIGPITSKTAREVGLPVDVEAEVHSVPGLVEAIVALFSSLGAGKGAQE